MSLNFTLDVIGSMDGNAGIGGGPGDFFKINFNGTQLFNYNFANYGPNGGNTQSYPAANSAVAQGNDGVNTLGYTGFPNGGNGIQDTIYNLVINGNADAAGVLAITFFDQSNENYYNNEHYGIDNVVADGTLASGGTTPLPAALPMFAGGLGIVGFLARRKRKAT